MKTKILLTLMMIGMPICVLANDPYHKYLKIAQIDIDAISYSELGSLDMNMIGSWIEDAQFRFNTGTPANNVDIKKNELSYEFRFKPKAWGQRSIEKDIIKTRMDQQDFAYQQLLNAALQQRYLKLIDYFQQHSKLRNLLASFELLRQESVLIQSEVSSEQFDPEKLLDTEEALKQSHNMIELYLHRLNALQSELGLPQDSMDSMKISSGINWVLNAAEIRRTTLTRQLEEQLSPAVLDAQMKLQLSQSETQLVKAKQQLGINLLKFEYSDRLTDEMAFQVGINIPLGASFDSSKSQHNVHMAKSQLNNSLAKTKQSLTEIRQQISWLAEDWEIVKNQIERRKKYLQKDYAKTNPFLAINLQKENINNKQKIADINRKTLTLYVSQLAMSGQLAQQPLRNWIRQGIPFLTQEKNF